MSAREKIERYFIDDIYDEDGTKVEIEDLEIERFIEENDKKVCRTEEEYRAIEESELVTKFENIGDDSTGNNYMIDVDLIDGSNITVYVDKSIFK